MAVTNAKLAQAKVAFEASPQPATVAQFMQMLREAEAADLITDDDFLDGLAAINEYLWKGGSVVDFNRPDSVDLIG